MSHPNPTKRAHFGEWHAHDLQLATTLWGDLQVTRYISMHGYSPEAIQNRLALEVTSQAADGVQYWPVFTPAQELIGCCGLQLRGAHLYELGYHLRPQYWGRGYATELAHAVVAFALQFPDAQALYARHHPDNLPSRHILVDKLGFQYTHHEVYAPTGLVTPSYRLPLTKPQDTPRLHFGHWQAGMSLAAQQLWGDPRVTALISAHGFTPDMVAKRLAQEVAALAATGVQYWPMFTAAGELVGACGLHKKAPGVYELGYHLRPEFWHQGLAEEAAHAVITFAIQVLQAKALTAGHHPDNQASKHIIQKLGFVYDHEVLYAPTAKRSPTYRLALPH
ncbi:GNAT family N-acetyltransferase [Lacticaseibacillus baoqingensis]|uniref:GNAT family N-acetyltransferase n=1 Tax=Lacticaseibacillus baoqingensis TaxID=2486013 RepID=A0ABW4EAX8_9LACO|nr:GNAT family N-acetyltransferase [Lacticaseibacillus baoqingensis]